MYDVESMPVQKSLELQLELLVQQIAPPPPPLESSRATRETKRLDEDAT